MAKQANAIMAGKGAVNGVPKTPITLNAIATYRGRYYLANRDKGICAINRHGSKANPEVAVCIAIEPNGATQLKGQSPIPKGWKAAQLQTARRQMRRVPPGDSRGNVAPRLTIFAHCNRWTADNRLEQ